MADLANRILYLIQSKPRMSMSEICRAINEKWKYYCGRRECFMNPRQRNTMVVFSCICEFRFRRVTYQIKKLEREGKINIQRERKPDRKNGRGWDWMKVSYSTLKIFYGGL